MYKDISLGDVLAALYYAHNRKKIKIPFPENPEWGAFSVEELGLTQRAKNCLMRAHIHCINDLIANYESLESIHGMGDKTKADIQYKLVEFYYLFLTNEEQEAFLKKLIAMNPPLAQVA